MPKSGAKSGSLPRNRPPNGRRGKKTGKSRKNKQNVVTGGGANVNTLVFEPWMPIFPASITKRLRYSTTCAIGATSGAITTTQVFRANDLFDPDYTGSGHQPMGFDQMMVWYNHFTVRKARIRVVAKNNASGSPTVCVRMDGNLTPITVIDRVVELGGCVTETLEAKGGYGANKVLELSVDIAQLQGVSPKTITADANLRGDAATSPVEITYFHICCWDTLGTTASVEVDVILDQLATFYEPRDITESFRGDRKEDTSDPELVLLGSSVLSEVCPPASTSLKRPISRPPRPCVQGISNLQAGGTASTSRRPV